MKKFIKKILKSRLFLFLLSKFIALYIRFIFLTIKWQGDSKHILKQYRNDKIILVFWHGRMLMMPFLWHNPKNMHVLISHHRDGEIIARTIKNIGYNLIRGSSSKGGVNAVKEIFKTLKNSAIAITPDGPRGPKRKIGGNLLAFAQKTGVPIILATYSTSNAKIMNSWDSMIIPKPFGKGIAFASDPIYIDKNLSDTELIDKSREIEQIINDMTDLADKKMHLIESLPKDTDLKS